MLRYLMSAVVFALLACDSQPYREVQVSPAADAAPKGSAERRHDRPLRFSVAAMESPRDTYRPYARLFGRIGKMLGSPVEFVQRRTYREVNDLLASGGLDAALVCTGGYLDLAQRAPSAVELVAVPVVHGDTTYRSLVIVPRDSPAKQLADLEGKRFAYTDELSFSGRLYVLDTLLHSLGRHPQAFFSGVTFTGSHDRSTRAVAAGLVDAAAVHSHIYGQLVERDPELARETRVIHHSPPFGQMPVVASTRLDPERRRRLREVLLSLRSDSEAASALAALHIDGFVAPTPGLYDAAAVVFRGSH